MLNQYHSYNKNVAVVFSFEVIADKHSDDVSKIFPNK